VTTTTGERASRVDTHPTVISVGPGRRPSRRGRRARRSSTTTSSGRSAWLRGRRHRFVEVTRPELADQRADIEAAFPTPEP